MAKFGGSAMTKIGNAAKRVSKSKVVRKTAIAGKKAVRGAKKGIAGVKGSGGLKSVLPKIKPIRGDLKQGGIRKINKLVESRVQNLIPKLSSKVEEKVDSFDPNKFLGKIFDGGLSSLDGFAGGLDDLKDNMDKNTELMEKANKLATDFINKLSKGKKDKKKKGGGLIGNVFKGLAVAGIAMLAAPAIAKVGLVGGAVAVGGNLLKKGIDFIRGKKKKKLEKKQEEARKEKKTGKTDTIFSSILAKLDGVLDFGKPKGEGEKESIPMDKPIPEKFIGGVLGFGKKKKEPENYQDLVKLGVTFDDTGVFDSARNVDVVYPREPHAADNKAMGNVRRRKHKQKTQSAYYSGFGSDPKHEKILNLPLEDFVNLQLYGIDPSEKDKKNAEKKGKAEVKNKRMRGMGAKDRGREGGNFSGKKQKNVRGEFAKGIMPNIGGLFGKSKDLLGGLMGGIGGMGSKIGSGIGDFLKSDAANFLSRGLTGTVGSGINLVKSLFQPSKEPLAKRAAVAASVSRPAKSSKGGAGTKPVGGAAAAALSAGGGGKAAQGKKMEREMVKPENSVPGLVAVDLNNMHVLHSKSVFNIVGSL